jgi:arylsulfatase A-like enzyme
MRSAVVAAAVLAAGVGAWLAIREPTAPPGPSFLLITVDTLRADALGSYGSTAGSSPNIDALAQRSLVFETAYSTAPFTGPSHASILTSQHPSSHGIVFNGHRVPAVIERQATAVSEHFQRRGISTAAFVSDGPLRPEYGFARGFDTFRYACPSRHGDVSSDGHCVTEGALRWLAARGEERFFLWVHYFDPHFPYVSTPEVYDALGMKPGDAVTEDVESQPLPAVRAAYQADVFEADLHVGRLLDHLEESGLLQTTVVALAADHGEYLGEHGLYDHLELYDEVLHVPMLLFVPGREGERRSGLVSTIDLIPTVLDAMGEPPLATAQGRSLLDRETQDEPVPVFAEWRHFAVTEGGEPEVGHFQIGVRLGDEKLIVDWLFPETGSLFFDLSRDRRETTNLFAAHPERVRALADILEDHLEVLNPALLRPLKLEFRESDIEMLRELGYIE